MDYQTYLNSVNLHSEDSYTDFFFVKWGDKENRHTIPVGDVTKTSDGSFAFTIVLQFKHYHGIFLPSGAKSWGTTALAEWKRSKVGEGERYLGHRNTQQEAKKILLRSFWKVNQLELEKINTSNIVEQTGNRNLEDCPQIAIKGVDYFTYEGTYRGQSVLSYGKTLEEAKQKVEDQIRGLMDARIVATRKDATWQFEPKLLFESKYPDKPKPRVQPTVIPEGWFSKVQTHSVPGGQEVLPLFDRIRRLFKRRGSKYSTQRRDWMLDLIEAERSGDEKTADQLLQLLQQDYEIAD